jgi:hypothetical protein
MKPRRQLHRVAYWCSGWSAGIGLTLIINGLAYGRSRTLPVLIGVAIMVLSLGWFIASMVEDARLDVKGGSHV